MFISTRLNSFERIVGSYMANVSLLQSRAGKVMLSVTLGHA